MQPVQKVNWKAVNFGLVGVDTFVNPLSRKDLNTMAKIMSKQIGEKVYYQVVEKCPYCGKKS